jgi:hypothetical protein
VEIPSGISPNAADLITKLLIKSVKSNQPKKRLNQPKQVYNHSFFNDIN